MNAHQANWAAVLRRDPAADGRFVYAVRSTGIYCRPSCGARRPRRENVTFHPSGDAARAAGFRPCRRCHPDLPSSGFDGALAAACRVLESSAASDSRVTLPALARQAGLSLTAFRRRFRAATGLSPRAWRTAARAARLRALLHAGRSVTEAFYEAGFGSSGRFYAAAPPMLGMKAAQFRAGGGRIRFALGRCSLGVVLAACSERGVCAILLGDDPRLLQHQLRADFPAADIEPADAALRRTLTRVIALLEHPRAGHTLPLDLRGTAFERRVWQALTRIPAGTHISYGELARRLGLPRGARAVARACAANRLAVAIPCHRAVRADGALAGYRWGRERKQRLLERERSASLKD